MVLTDWIAIFKTGRHTDSAGNTRDWTEEDLDRIVESYDPARGHEAPVVIGHPEANAPAYGWVERLKRVGNLLFYRERDPQPEFTDMRKRGMFKKRSISLYPDGTLRHVGWLGAQPPAVKGLPDFAFGDEGGMTIEFQETGKEETEMNFWERLKEKLSKAGVSFKELFGSDEPPVLYTEADVRAKAEAAAAEALRAKEQEFSETARKKEEDLKRREDALRQKEAEARKAGIAAFCEDLKKKGILTPAMERLGMGVTAFMQSVASIEQTVEFGEGDGKGRQTPLEFMQAFLGALPKSVEFGEVEGRGTEAKTGSAGEKLDALTTEKMKANKELKYAQAFAEVQKEHPALAAEYAEELAER